LLLNAEGGLQVTDFGGEFIPPRTADYTAPERFAGTKPSPAIDVYSLGATYFALLTGHAPFADVTGDDALAEAHAARTVPNVRAGSSEMPLRCELIVRQAMAKSPSERYSSVAGLRADLEALIDADRALPIPKSQTFGVKSGMPPRLRSNWLARVRPWLPSASLVLLAALCAGAYFAFPLLRSSRTHHQNKSENPEVVKRPTITNSLGMRLIQVPAGIFDMGDPLLADARPHTVRITRPFFIGATEVTQREFQQLMGSNPSHFRSDGNPVDSVTWDEAREFCERLSQQAAEKNAGRTYRLPTEAEWEHACRAGTRTHFAFGNRIRLDQANTRIGGLSRTTPAGTYPPNAWGIFDMHGNVWEWCSDWYKSDYFSESPIEDPQGPATGAVRVVRGGSWMVGPEDCASAKRGDMCPPAKRRADVGFRVIGFAPDFEGEQNEK
jgi:formylglycine-generating enzyme required for sulfatase activity